MAAKDIVLQAMMEKYNQLKDYGLVENHSNSWPKVWKNLKEKQTEWYKALKKNESENLGKWEHGARICCNGRRKYYVAEVGTSFMHQEVVPENTPPCDEDDTMVRLFTVIRTNVPLLVAVIKMLQRMENLINSVKKGYLHKL